MLAFAGLIVSALFLYDGKTARAWVALVASFTIAGAAAKRIDAKPAPIDKQ